jgi:hypothetical protein
MFASRFIEGAGYALIPVCAIGAIAVCLAKFR